ncbi:hypothetical protein ACMGDH_18135 [Sphingomonas sp. DT-207]|uniref:hypothetical protein n=1 Tax=Sphingomonas sp. DT-207 TaxID=3396167 RepID=UPI003F1D411F
MNIKRIAHLAAAASAALALAACGGGADEEQPAPSNVETMTIPEPGNMTELPEEAPPAARIDNTATDAIAAPAPEIAPTEQVQDDAAATGMTARVSRDEGGNEAQPAE